MPEFSAADIHVLRGPELEETAEGCLSRWLLRIEAPADQPSLTALAMRLTAEIPDAGVGLTRLGPDTVRLDLLLPVSPLLVESFLVSDEVFAGVHATLGIVEINDSPRRHWRTGRRW